MEHIKEMMGGIPLNYSLYQLLWLFMRSLFVQLNTGEKFSEEIGNVSNRHRVFVWPPNSESVHNIMAIGGVQQWGGYYFRIIVVNRMDLWSVEDPFIGGSSCFARKSIPRNRLSSPVDGSWKLIIPGMRLVGAFVFCISMNVSFSLSLLLFPPTNSPS